jgi:ABC-type lipoprotein release transport system permease subunit
MALEPRLAWRNVWRNPRRTALSIGATVFAVVLVVVFVAMATGSHEKMIEDAVRIHSGHVTLTHNHYRETQTLEHFVPQDPALVRAVEETPGVRGWAPRVVSFALLSMDTASQGAVVMGVDPVREGSVTFTRDRVVEGRFLTSSADSTEREIVLGRRLAESLDVGLGDELLLYGVAYSLETAYELFTVVGLVRLAEPQFEKTLAIIDLDVAQEFFVYEDKLTEIAILTDDAEAAPGVRAALVETLAASHAGEFDVATWDELMPELVQFILLDDAGMYVLLVILVVVVGFGILNTILMAILERTREFGVVMALGLGRSAIFRLVYLESLYLAGVGLLLGFALSIPIVLYFEANPIPLVGGVAEVSELIGFDPVITFKLRPLNPIGSTLTIMGVAIMAAIYPAVKASRSRPVDALRSV